MQANYKIIEGKILAKRIGEDFKELPSVESTDAESHYKNVFLKFQKQADAVFEKIDATENKGSYLAKIVLLSDQLKALDAIGDLETLFSKLEKYRLELTEKVESNRIRNAEIKKILLESLAKIVNENNWRATEEVKEIQQKWIKVGKATLEEDQKFALQYEELKQSFFNQKKEFFESQKEVIEVRTQQYREIIKELETISDSAGFKDARARVDELVELWKSNGAISKASYDTLFDLYKKNLDCYFEKLKKATKKSIPKDINKDLLKKKEVVLAQLLEYKNATARFDLKKIHGFKDQWNNIGKLHGKVLGKIGEQFYQTIEFLYEYSNLQNYQEKKSFGLDSVSLAKTLKRFISENEEEIKQFKENQDQMNIKLSSDSINDMFAKRLRDLEKKLEAKKRVLSTLL